MPPLYFNTRLTSHIPEFNPIQASLGQPPNHEAIQRGYTLSSNHPLPSPPIHFGLENLFSKKASTEESISTLSARVIRGDLDAFKNLLSLATHPTNETVREEAKTALGTLNLNENQWRVLAEQQGRDIDTAACYWEALGMMGLIYNNVSAKSAFSKANLAPYANDPSLRLFGVFNSEHVLWVALARLWGNETLDRGFVGGVLKLRFVMAQFAYEYQVDETSYFFDERSYQKNLEHGHVSEAHQKIHAAFEALARKPEQSPAFVQDIECDFVKSADYIGLIANIAMSLGHNETNIQIAPWITELAARVLGDPVLASTPDGVLLATVFGTHSRSNISALRDAFEKFRIKPDHLFRFLVFLSTNQEALLLSDENLYFILNGLDAKPLTAEELLSNLPGIQNQGRRLITSMALRDLKKYIEGMEKVLNRNIPKGFLEKSLTQDIEALTQFKKIFRRSAKKKLTSQALREDFQNSYNWHLASIAFVALDLSMYSIREDPDFLKSFFKKRDEEAQIRGVSKAEVNLDYIKEGLLIFLRSLINHNIGSEAKFEDIIDRRADYRILEPTGDGFHQALEEIFDDIATMILNKPSQRSTGLN